MKYIWEEKDIEAGRFLIKQSAPENFKDVGFAASVSFKIGFTTQGEQSYCLISIFTDGWVYMAGSKDKLAKYLNKCEDGYRPMTRSEAHLIIDNCRQSILL